LIEVPDKILEVIYNALKPESESALRLWSKVDVKETEDGLLLEFDARDTSSLRAALNSYLRWISMLTDILNRL